MPSRWFLPIEQAHDGICRQPGFGCQAIYGISGVQLYRQIGSRICDKQIVCGEAKLEHFAQVSDVCGVII